MSVLAIAAGTGICLYGGHLRGTDAAVYGYVEIFDITEGRVVKQVEPDIKIQREAEKLLKDVSGLYTRLRPLPDSGLIVRIPLEPPADIRNEWLNGCGITRVDALYILLPGEGAPYLLVLDEGQRPWFFNFKGKADKLLKYIS